MRGPLLVLGLSLSLGAMAAESNPRVTTDTAEYCGSLALRLAGLPLAAREPSRSLAEEGVKLCGNGHVRTGIAKLRRALRAAMVVPELPQDQAQDRRASARAAAP